MRTFIAIEIPGRIRERIQELLDVLRRTPSDIRWSRPEALHITLKFLGEIPAEKVEEVKARLKAISSLAPLPIQLEGAGFFPNERSPRVIWLGIQAGVGLRELAASVEDCLVPLGFPKENRPFSAHLTLGRVRAPNSFAALREILRSREPLEMGSFTAQEFYLYESQLTSDGSIYRKIARFPLAAPAPAEASQ